MAGEEEGDLGSFSGAADGDARRHLARGERVEAGEKSLAVVAEDDGAALQRRPHQQRAPNLGAVRVTSAHAGRQPRRALAQGRLRFGGKHERNRAGQGQSAASRLAALDPRRLGRLLEDQVSIGAAGTEGRDAGTAGATPRLPGDRLAQQLDLARLPIDLRRGPVDVQGLRQQALAHRQHRLDHPAHSGRRLGVADVRLQRAQPERPLALLAVGREQGPRLDRVAEGGAGAVRLDRVDVRRPQAGFRQGLADHPLLRGAVWGGEAVRCTVLVDRGAADRGEHLAALALGVGEPFQRQHADALGEAGAVCCLGEGLAATVGGDAALTAELDEDAGHRQHRDPAGERQATLAAAQRLAGEVQRDER